jgi:hypothetical protein
MRHKFTDDRVRIKFFFWLIDKQWPPVMDVYRQIKEQKNDAARTRRQPLDGSTVIGYSVLHLYVVGAI